MKRFVIAATFGGLVALTGCTTVETSPSADSTTTVAQQPVQSEPATSGSASGGSAGGGFASGGDIAPCTAASITPTLENLGPSDVQTTAILRYVNSGPASCNVTGYPGATLEGPDFEGLGPDYDLPRGETVPSTTITLQPGQAAEADLTLGTLNKNADKAWLPTAFLTTAPGDTTVMSIPFPNTVAVQRQDGATHPASFIDAFRGPVD